MNKSLKTFLISFATCIVCLGAYHIWNKNQVITIEENYGRLVAQKENKSLSSIIRNDISNSLPLDFIAPANLAKNAVVAVKAVQIKGNSWRKDKYTRSNGSGVILSSNGYIVTNYHVIEDADNIEVILESKKEYKCELIGFDRSTDLALLKIDAENLSYLEFGNSAQLQVGEWVLAVGNPFKLQSSVTAGIVSAKARNINIFNRQGIESFIQTDAAINPGNSGGALINRDGYLIGINTAILTYSGKYEGFSFAVPSTIVKKVVDDLREYGAVQRAWLGIGILEVDDKMASEADLDFIGGVYINLVERDGAAKEAELKSKDIIVSINGTPTMTVPEFTELIGQYRPGDEVEIAYYRNGEKNLTFATLRNQLNTTDFIAVRKDKLFTDLGFELRDLDTEEKGRLNSKGAMVVSIIKGTKIDKTNMDPSYIITSINDAKVESVDDLLLAIKKITGRVEIKGFYENWPGDYPYVFYMD